MSKQRVKETLRFVITGGVCFAVEFLVLTLLHELLHIDTLIATPIAFLISVIVNYLLCVVWVFDGAKDNGSKTRLGFLITSLMGLLLNELLMYLFRILFGEETVLMTIGSFRISMYMVNKALATVLVMIWNYFTKRKVLLLGQNKE